MRLFCSALLTLCCWDVSDGAVLLDPVRLTSDVSRESRSVHHSLRRLKQRKADPDLDRKVNICRSSGHELEVELERHLLVQIENYAYPSDFYRPRAASSFCVLVLHQFESRNVDLSCFSPLFLFLSLQVPSAESGGFGLQPPEAQLSAVRDPGPAHGCLSQTFQGNLIHFSEHSGYCGPPVEALNDSVIFFFSGKTILFI